jgi:hypothetical protein
VRSGLRGKPGSPGFRTKLEETWERCGQFGGGETAGTENNKQRLPGLGSAVWDLEPHGFRNRQRRQAIKPRASRDKLLGILF